MVWGGERHTLTGWGRPFYVGEIKGAQVPFSGRDSSALEGSQAVAMSMKNHAANQNEPKVG